MLWLTRGNTWQTLSAAAAFLLIVGNVAAKLLKRRRRWTKFQEALLGERPEDALPGQEHRPGLLERMGNLEAVTRETGERIKVADASSTQILAVLADHGQRLAAVEVLTAALNTKLIPNGGSSVADKIDKIAAAVLPPESA